jgi:hypothetical protein
MRLSLKTKFTLAISLLVLAVVTAVSALYIARLTRQTLRQADDRARFIAQQVFLACQNALADAAERGDSPTSLSPADLREYARKTFDNSSSLNSVIESAVDIRPRFTRLRSATATASFSFQATLRSVEKKFPAGQVSGRSFAVDFSSSFVRSTGLLKFLKIPCRLT